MEERNVASWEQFLGGLEEIRKERASSANYVQDSLLFRGQGSSCWQGSARASSLLGISCHIPAVLAGLHVREPS
jgi:hypothetical protein